MAAIFKARKGGYIKRKGVLIRNFICPWRKILASTILAVWTCMHWKYLTAIANLVSLACYISCA